MYKRKGPAIVQKNLSAIDMSTNPNALVNVQYPTETWEALPLVLLNILFNLSA